jgi:hypothetical protein
MSLIGREYVGLRAPVLATSSTLLATYAIGANVIFWSIVDWSAVSRPLPGVCIGQFGDPRHSHVEIAPKLRHHAGVSGHAGSLPCAPSSPRFSLASCPFGPGPKLAKLTPIAPRATCARKIPARPRTGRAFASMTHEYRARSSCHRAWRCRGLTEIPRRGCQPPAATRWDTHSAPPIEIALMGTLVRDATLTRIGTAGSAEGPQLARPENVTRPRGSPFALPLPHRA